MLEQKYSETEGEENELFGGMDINNLRTSFSNVINRFIMPSLYHNCFQYLIFFMLLFFQNWLHINAQSLNSDSKDDVSSILKRKNSPSKYSVKPSRLVELPKVFFSNFFFYYFSSYSNFLFLYNYALKILLSTTPRIYTLEAIDKFTCELLKSECGYKLAREIIRDSELEVKFIHFSSFYFAIHFNFNYYQKAWGKSAFLF